MMNINELGYLKVLTFAEAVSCKVRSRPLLLLLVVKDTQLCS